MSLKNIFYLLFFLVNSFVHINGSDEEKGSETTSLVNNESKHQHNEWGNKVYECFILVGELSYSIAGIIFTIMEGEDGKEELKDADNILRDCHKKNPLSCSIYGACVPCQEEQKEYNRIYSCGPHKFESMIDFYSIISFFAFVSLFINITGKYCKWIRSCFCCLESILSLGALGCVFLSVFYYFLNYTCHNHEIIKYAILVFFLSIAKIYKNNNQKEYW